MEQRPSVWAMWPQQWCRRSQRTQYRCTGAGAGARQCLYTLLLLLYTHALAFDDFCLE